jgi:hypothetical protein
MADAFRIWPRSRATAMWLIVLIGLQTSMFFIATRRSFFTHEDFYNFALAGDRSFLKYLLTPIVHVYPAPGHRLLFWVLHQCCPLNYGAARSILLAMLAGTTILLAAIVRSLARSDRWWTVTLLTPFALSLTLVSPVNLWSNGVPVMPALLCTVIAIAAWMQAYTRPNAAWWIAITVAAIGAASTVYMKFLLIPLYLLYFRVAIFPSTMKLSASLRALWQERARLLSLAIPVVVFLAVYLGSGLAERSYVAGDRPYAAYFTAAWFAAVVPVSVLNMALSGSPASSSAWLVVVVSQVLFWLLVAATWMRSRVSLRGWALFLLVFIVNTAMVGAVRLPAFGVEIAYWLRYYPEVVLFFPMGLALALRQGEERSPALAWENTRRGRGILVSFACLHALAFAMSAPRIVSQSEGVQAKGWIDNLRGDLHAVTHDPSGAVRIVDSDTPEYIVLSWMNPYNRISIILTLLNVRGIYNDVSGPAYVVLPNGHLAPAGFHALTTLVPAPPAGRHAAQPGECLQAGAPFEYQPAAPIAGERLALRVVYAARTRHVTPMQIGTDDPDRPLRYLELRPQQNTAELIDLGTSRLEALRIEPQPGDALCIERMEIGSLQP